MKKVFGLFDSPKSTREAVKHLVKKSVSESRLSIVSDNPGSLGKVERRERKAPLAEMGSHKVRVVESNLPMSSQLRDMGLPTESLPYYTNHIRLGGVVLVVDAEQESAETIASILRNADGKVS